MPNVVVTLQNPELTVAVKAFKPNVAGVNVAGFAVCPLLQRKEVPLVVKVKEVEVIPHIVGIALPAMVIDDVANIPTEVTTLHKPELTVTIKVFNPNITGVNVTGLAV